MKRYTEEYIERLLAKFMDGTSSVEEESILGEYFRTQGGREEWAEYRRMFAYFDSGMTSLPPAETTQKAHRRFAFLHPKWIAAAAAVAVLALMVSVWQLKEDSVGQTALAEKNATEVAKEMHRAASTEHSDAASKFDTGIQLAKAQAADEKNDAKTTEKNIHRNIRNNSIASANATNASEIPTKESTAKSQYSIEEATKEELKMALTELERTQNEIAEYNSEVIMANLEMHNLDGVVREEQSYGGDAHDYSTPEIRYLRAMTMQ